MSRKRLLHLMKLHLLLPLCLSRQHALLKHLPLLSCLLSGGRLSLELRLCLSLT